MYVKVLRIVVCFLLSSLPVEASSGLWRNVGVCGQGLDCDPACQLRCLEIHNYYRSLHNSPPLSCDPELAKSAQEWTDEQAAAGKMHHSPYTDKFSECIGYREEGWRGANQRECAIAEIVRGWYSEIKNDYNHKTGNGRSVGNFQAVIWSNTTKTGCGIKYKPGDGTYATVRYTPAMHIIEFTQIALENMRPRKAADPSCDVRSSERELCAKNLSSPCVTPDQCISNGCCYDDTFINEPNVHHYSSTGSTWCFKHND